MSLSLADLPTELLDQAVPLIDFEGKNAKLSVNDVEDRSWSSNTQSSPRNHQVAWSFFPEGVMERRSSAVVDATIKARVTGSAPASLISLGEMPAMEWIKLINSFGSRLAQFLHDGVTTRTYGVGLMESYVSDSRHRSRVLYSIAHHLR
ncbi:hypothetical protein MCOR27_006869 [Pyricularia oryzae]|nr:hypothetical protein MCOR02_004873 [Pyricularia oryzae]KAI6275646.1 hypothetical protein MCOR27_006869 [Pyricularia oryzae]KAI6285029.1 hypothetical protein MCOR26_001729 [Pyricularia oryzae]KAI6325434.1 hypothetical protein MCOR30_006779 [Pyricularia oryzae]KAI6326670.1 hypothetical protein MCOR29_003355 [Pyricularia oryzae]